MTGASRPRLLDVGCGDGTTAVKRGWPEAYDYIGLDVDEEKVELAREKGLEVRIGDATKLDESDSSVDRCVVKAVLEHVEDPVTVVEECRRVLRPGGEFMAAVPSDRSYDVWGDYTHLRAFRKDAFEDLLVDGGFERDSIELSPRMGWGSVGMAVKSVARIVAPWTPYGYPRAWVATATCTKDE